MKSKISAGGYRKGLSPNSAAMLNDATSKESGPITRTTVFSSGAI